MKRCRQKSGFTLIELLMVVAVIAILASLLRPALSRAKEKGRVTVCRNNMRQIGLGFAMYLHDNNDTFPTVDHVVPRPEDWIYWSGPTHVNSAIGFNHGANQHRSPITSYTSFQTNLFRCPSHEFLKRLDRGQDGFHPGDRLRLYPFSYTLSAHSGRVSNGNYPGGMASLFFEASPPGYFRIAMVRNPSDKIMLVDEATLDEPHVVPQSLPWPTSGWWWDYGKIAGGDQGGYPSIGDEVTRRHSRKGTVVHADGHVEVVGTNYWRTQRHYDARFGE
jgi:prepilin-type N-terminal cleavage/methylation domain-containing protein/prepilin-type processing-associated H-X9-DG protein